MGKEIEPDEKAGHSDAEEYHAEKTNTPEPGEKEKSGTLMLEVPTYSPNSIGSSTFAYDLEKGRLSGYVV